MKNIHVLQTDKPSNIVISTIDGKLKLNNNPNDNVEYHGENQHIYITNDEEIKEGGWFYLDDAIIIAKYISVKPVKEAKKIILTTDQYLIKDGVQAIDYEFLQWFVQNPSCEWVWIKEKQHFEADKSKRKNPLNGVYYSYKIIIPKEEPKQETIREVVKRYYEDNIDESNIPREHYEWEIQDLMIGFAYQWQQEQNKKLYSKEEVVQLLQKALTHQDDGEIGNLVTAQKEIRTANFYSWFNKFKNK
jgi:hypothetical protein